METTSKTLLQIKTAQKNLLEAIGLQQTMLQDMHDYIVKRDEIIQKALKKFQEKLEKIK